MTNLELIESHEAGTNICSVMSHMRSASPTYTEIIAKGKDIVPDILLYLKERKSGMNVMLLLTDILKTTPYEPKTDRGFAEFIVADARKAWIEWGKKEKLI